MPSDSEEKTQRLVIELCRTRLPKTYGFDALEDIQVLCPSKMGRVGTETLNGELQLALNPPSKNKQEMPPHYPVCVGYDKTFSRLTKNLLKLHHWNSAARYQVAQDISRAH